MNKNNNKTGRIAVLILIVLALVGFGYMALFGVGDKAVGSYKNVSKGLDLAGGLSITYQVVNSDITTQEDLDDTMEKLRNKAETYSTEALVYEEGSNNDRITVEIPGITDADDVLQELGKPGSLYFISETDSEGNVNYTYKVAADGSYVFHDEKFREFIYITEDQSLAVEYDNDTNLPKVDENGNYIPIDLLKMESVELSYTLLKPIEELKANGSILLEGADVAEARAVVNQKQNEALREDAVALTFTKEGAEAFGIMTTKAAKDAETIAIYYDGNFLSVPTVKEPITSGEASISGSMDDIEAKRLASKIKIGALKLELEELRSNIVGAQLGSNAVKTSLIAAAIGFAVVAILMIAIYRLPGFASVIGLGVYTVLIVVILSVFNEAITLTLPGIAGIILSIGMAVDANVIVFARIREELATGKTLQSSVDIGFKKAASAILDGNITTFIAAIVLMIFGSGSVRGFAQTLAIGIALSMFTAMIVTRGVINGFIALGLDNLKLYGIGKERKVVNFLSKGNIFALISGAIIVAGLITMCVFKGTTGDFLNYSLEFKGGTSTTLELPTDMTIEEIDANITPGIEKITGDGNVQIQKVENSNQIVVKTRSLNEVERGELTDYLEGDCGVSTDTIESETISGTISGEMKREAIVAITIAVACMLVYIWIRFSDFRFGVSSILALCHDVLIMLVFYGISRTSVSSTFIACILTIVGYSINATIVIFDRIRENMKEEQAKVAALGSRKKKKSAEDAVVDVKAVVNKSITQTLSRSIFTSLTTFVMVLFLYILGVTSIKEFALPLMIGVVCGTYSSICLAGFFWYMLRKIFKPGQDEDEDDLP